MFIHSVNSQQIGKRLDIAVSSLVSDCSRVRASDLIRQGNVLVHGTVKKPSYKLKAGDEISYHIPPPEPVRFEPEAMELDILYEDEHLILINKPPGLVVHPAPGHYTGTLVNGLLYHCPDLKGIGGKLRPGIVHRLDKETSGTLVAAKNELALEGLAQQFKSRTIKKKYLAIVHGAVKDDSGVISLPIGRHPVFRKKMSTKSRHGRVAETHWQIRKRFAGASLLELDLKTGRTHQIRVHCAAIGHPVIGDEVYGGRKTRKFSGVLRQMLHALSLEFTHPVTKERMCFESPLPKDIERVIKFLFTTSPLSGT